MVWNQKRYTVPWRTILGVYIFQHDKAMILETVNKFTDKANNLKPKRNVVAKIKIKKMIWLLQLNCNERRRILYGLYHDYVIVITYLLPAMFN